MSRVLPDWAFLTVNAVGYQAVWAAAVLGAAAGYAAAGPLAAAAFIASQVAIAPNARRELALVGISAGIGLVVDSAQAAAGVFAFQAPLGPVWLCPPWLLAIWAAFGTTLNGCMRWLKGRPWLGAAVGAVGGPLAYWAGARLGAISLEVPLATAMVVLAGVWAAVLPLLAGAATWLERKSAMPAVGGRLATQGVAAKRD